MRTATTQPHVDLGRERSFDALIGDVRGCTDCEQMSHSHVLGPANGRLDAQIMFVAEAVGRRGGAVTGVPLTRDESGKRFERFLRIAGIDRGDVFITNAVLCNPIDASGANRPPRTSEVARCRPFLAATLEIVGARLVVALGRIALESLRVVSPHDVRFDHEPGAAHRWNGRTLVALYHPSRQSTLHRSQGAQEADWRRLGQIARTLRLTLP
jgi:uracil-DNA glycosylase family 4